MSQNEAGVKISRRKAKVIRLPGTTYDFISFNWISEVVSLKVSSGLQTIHMFSQENMLEVTQGIKSKTASFFQKCMAAMR